MANVFCQTFSSLNKIVVDCTLCPRLVAHRETVPPAPAHRNETHWRRPVHGFGDPFARLFILGLAPAPQGGNRTGRIFTGDRTGMFLMKALHATGFANQPLCENVNDGLELHDCYLSAAVKCVPPEHKPLPQEFRNCSRYLANEFFLLKKVKAVLALGKDAFKSYFHFLNGFAGLSLKLPPFFHGQKVTIEGWPTLHVSFHPTPHNVNTGRLTEAMFLKVLNRIKEDL
jgi:uracil-DNA glycosylase family 4